MCLVSLRVYTFRKVLCLHKLVLKLLIGGMGLKRLLAVERSGKYIKAKLSAGKEIDYLYMFAHHICDILGTSLGFCL